MSKKGFYLHVGDKTSCGGKITSGVGRCDGNDNAMAHVGHSCTCGVDGKTYSIFGAVPEVTASNNPLAGTAHSYSSCPCMATFSSNRKSISYSYQSESEKNSYLNSKQVEVEREAVDPGFSVVPFIASPKTFESHLFVRPPAGTIDLYRGLNPERKKKAGSIVIVADPKNYPPDKIKILKDARDKVDNALESLSDDEAALLYKNRTSIDIFASQNEMFSEALSETGDYLGLVSELGSAYHEEIKKLLEEIESLYKNTYMAHGSISGEEFFAKRKMLFQRLDLLLNKYTKSQYNMRQDIYLKNTLGLSTRSIVHNWNQTGVTEIEGYATYIEKSAKLVKILSRVGYVGIGLDFSSYTANVYEACSKGRDDECRKAAIVEYSKFGAKQASGIATGAIAGNAARGGCMWVLGIMTSEVGGIGSAVCLVTGIGTGIVAGKFTEKWGESKGEKFGDMLNNSIDISNSELKNTDTINEANGILFYERLFNR
ncbi:PAAR domain-containing protein [Lelliottia amnigena]|uniref:PAAR domain-containing protein n=1 Tax=Lelliottia amnigena TaxID=61646 RepID=UPI004055F090